MTVKIIIYVVNNIILYILRNLCGGTIQNFKKVHNYLLKVINDPLIIFNRV